MTRARSVSAGRMATRAPNGPLTTEHVDAVQARADPDHGAARGPQLGDAARSSRGASRRVADPSGERRSTPVGEVRPAATRWRGDRARHRATGGTRGPAPGSCPAPPAAAPVAPAAGHSPIVAPARWRPVSSFRCTDAQRHGQPPAMASRSSMRRDREVQAVTDGLADAPRAPGSRQGWAPGRPARRSALPSSIWATPEPRGASAPARHARRVRRRARRHRP